MQDRGEELVKWRLPCPIQKQVGINPYQIFSAQNKAYKYAMSIFQFSSVAGLIQSFSTSKTSSHTQDTGPDYSTELTDQFT